MPKVVRILVLTREFLIVVDVFECFESKRTNATSCFLRSTQVFSDNDRVPDDPNRLIDRSDNQFRYFLVVNIRKEAQCIAQN